MYFIFLDESLFFFDGPVNICVFLQKISFYFKVFLAIALAHQAIHKAVEYVRNDRNIVVDIDLEKYFDRVNHDILMSRLARRIADKRLLKIIRKFLKAGIMNNGICVKRWCGTPQGGPLSPLLSNILLDDLDKELEQDF
jgi:RNA-directed DNA polymerase